MSNTTTKKKSNPGKKRFPCTGGYSTHSWNHENVGGPVTPEILNSCCLRCGVKFEDIYNFRKGLTIKRYHASK